MSRQLTPQFPHSISDLLYPVGYSDGISQPYIQIEDDATKRRAPLPGQLTVNPGVIICKQPGDPQPKHPGWTSNGSFLVYRHLKQLVPEFDKFLEETVLKNILDPPANPGPDQEVINAHPEDIQKRVDFLGARFVGRWKSGTYNHRPHLYLDFDALVPLLGAPIVLSHDEDNKELGADPLKNNKFEFPTDQIVCPFAAHIRKTGPRNDLPTTDPTKPNNPPAIETRSIVRGGTSGTSNIPRLLTLFSFRDYLWRGGHTT